MRDPKSLQKLPSGQLRQVSLPPTAFKVKTTPEFCATFVPFCAVYDEFCATPLMGDSHIMPCVHRGILAGLSVPKEFSRVWSTVNFVLLLCYFVPHTPNFVPCSLWQILTLCHVYTVAFLWVSVFPSNFQVSEALWILCYFCAILCHIGRILCHAPYGRFWHMPCVHSDILAGLSVPTEFSRVWSIVNFVLLLCYFVPHTPNFVPCPLWEILT